MLAPTKITKLENNLNVLQLACRTRTLSIEEIKEVIESAEDAVKTTTPALRPAMILEYQPHSVAKSYGYRAEGTILSVWFNKAGKAIKATVSREQVVESRTRFVLQAEAVKRFIADELKISEENQTTELFNYVVRSNGFSTAHMSRLVTL